MQDVLILHNGYGKPEDDYYLSRYGVMDQVKAVAKALVKLGITYEIKAVDSLVDVNRILTSRKEHVIFNLVEEFIEDAEQACYVPAVCRAYGREYTGNGTETLIFGRNKAVSKAVLSAYGVRCPAGCVVTGGNIEPLKELTVGRYIFKPACCDASEGITEASIIDLPNGLERASELVRELYRRFSQPIVVEQFIDGRELNVSVLELGGRPKVLAIAEIDFSAFSGDMVKIVGYDAKWQQDSFAYNNTNRIIPASLSRETVADIERMAMASWKAIGCSGYIRVDFRLDENDVPYVIEVNPNPDISPDAGFAAALEYAEIDYDRFVWSAIGRNTGKYMPVKK